MLKCLILYPMGSGNLLDVSSGDGNVCLSQVMGCSSNGSPQICVLRRHRLNAFVGLLSQRGGQTYGCILYCHPGSPCHCLEVLLTLGGSLAMSIWCWGTVPMCQVLYGTFVTHPEPAVLVYCQCSGPWDWVLCKSWGRGISVCKGA